MKAFYKTLDDLKKDARLETGDFGRDKGTVTMTNAKGEVRVYKQDAKGWTLK